MNMVEAVHTFKQYHLTTLKNRTKTSYASVLSRLQNDFADRLVESIRSDEIGHFLDSLTPGLAKSTRRLRYAQTKAFFNFIINEREMDMKNPRAYPLVARQYKSPKQSARKILDKEIVDEMIYSARSPRDRLLLELQARCGLESVRC